MEAEYCPDPAVDYPQHCLPEDRHQYEASELAIILGDEDRHLPGKLF